MDCILRVISGSDAGTTARLQPGSNLIGRSPKAALRLKPGDISYEHCTITRAGDEYVVENLSALGTYLDDAKLSGPVKLRPRDELRLSKDTVVRLEAVGGESGLLAGRRGVLATLIILMMGMAGFIAWNVMGPTKLADDWNGAYYLLEPWVKNEVRANRLSADTTVLFRDAWRLEQAEDYAGSLQIWLRLQLTLDSVEGSQGLQKASAEHPQALQHMLSSRRNIEESPVSDEEMSAAFAQFVKRRLDYSSRQAKK